MALTPQNDEAFLREVDEELRRDQLTSFWQRWGKLLVAGIVVALAILGGFLWWQDNKAKEAGLRGEKFSAAVQTLTQGKDDKTVQTTLDTLASGDSDGYRAAAKLVLAERLLKKNDLKGAAAAFRAIAEDGTLPEPFRDLALVRSVSAEFDTLPPATVIDRLKPVAIAGHPWFGSAGEMVGLSYLKLNQPAQAAAIFTAMAKDPGVPDSIRTRVLRLAAGLGVDASAIAQTPVKE